MKLLLAEDDELLADGLSTQLRQAGYDVEHAANGAVAEYLLKRARFDVAVLDVGLPMIDGLSVLRVLREQYPQLPVLMLSARDALDDRMAGFEAGADDYVTKPFDLPELLARLQALLRRSQTQGSSTQLGLLVFDAQRHRAAVNGEAIELSRREWTLLEVLVQQRQSVVTKEQILQIWSGESVAEPISASTGNMIEVYIHRLRRKLEGAEVQIRTVRGLGYLLEATGS